MKYDNNKDGWEIISTNLNYFEQYCLHFLHFFATL